MVDINDFGEEKACTYKNEEYLVRDNGAVLRKARLNQKIRKLDNEWTFGKLNEKIGYHGLSHCIESASVVYTADIGVVLRALSALRTRRYDRRHCGKKDKMRK